MMDWHKPQPQPSIALDEIHIWRFDLEVPETQIDASLDLLSADERQRAKRFIFKQHFNHFVAARGSLRRTLGLYLQADPAALRFT